MSEPKKKFVAYKELVNNRNSSWGRDMTPEDEEKFRKTPDRDTLRLACELYTIELLDKISSIQTIMLKEQREFYDEMLKEQRVLKNLRK